MLRVVIRLLRIFMANLQICIEFIKKGQLLPLLKWISQLRLHIFMKFANSFFGSFFIKWFLILIIPFNYLGLIIVWFLTLCDDLIINCLLLFLFSFTSFIMLYFYYTSRKLVIIFIMVFFVNFINFILFFELISFMF